MQLFTILLVNPIINVLLIIYHVLLSLHVPETLGFSIILLTVAIRFLLYPIMATQMKSAKKMQELSPHLNTLRTKHKGDPQRLQQETLALYREHGYNPISGCLPLLIQLPVIWALYAVLQQIVHTDPHHTVATINAIAYTSALKLTRIWDTTFFGLPLGQTPSQLLSKVGPVMLLVPIITGALQFIQSKMMFGNQPKKDPAKKGEKGDDFAAAFQTQSLYIFPILIGYFSFNFPIGLSLYWNTFTVFGIIQQWQIQRGKKPLALAKK